MKYKTDFIFEKIRSGLLFNAATNVSMNHLYQFNDINGQQFFQQIMDSSKLF